ncbi:MAG: seryl-tRNA synthetase, partial [Pseudohongiellaceae bacterium]
MLQVAFIREHREDIITGLAKRNIDATQMVDDAIFFDEERKQLQTELDNTLAESNTISKEIGILYKSGKATDANILKEKIAILKQDSKTLGDQLNAKSDELTNLLYKIPNVPHE